MAETTTDTATNSQVRRPKLTDVPSDVDALRTRKTLDVLKQLGTSSEALAPLENLIQRIDEIKSHQFQAAKESAQIAELYDHTVRALVAIPERDEREAAAERDRELKQIDAEIAQARMIPNRRLAETDTEYSTKLLRHSVTEQRDLAGVTASGADVQLAIASDDPALLASLVLEAIEDGHPERIRRVARAAEWKLSKLALAEQGSSSGAGAAAPAFEASQIIANQLREWRAAEAERSPKVKRQRVLDRYTLRTAEGRRMVAQAARQFGLDLSR